MKNLLTLALLFASAPALAHSGGHSLVCKSAKNSGSKQVVEFELRRSNSTGFMGPSFSITVDGKKTDATTDDIMLGYGSTFHNSPLGLIRVTADNSEDAEAKNNVFVSVTAIPATVKAYNTEGKRVKWTLEQEKDDCGDANGRATFKGILRGSIKEDKDGPTTTVVEPQIMDCRLVYGSGMAC